MQPDVKPDVSEVADFDTGKLKHVSTEEKVTIPTKEGKHSHCRVQWEKFVVCLELVLQKCDSDKVGCASFHMNTL